MVNSGAIMSAALLIYKGFDTILIPTYSLINPCDRSGPRGLARRQVRDDSELLLEDGGRLLRRLPELRLPVRERHGRQELRPRILHEGEQVLPKVQLRLMYNSF